MRTNLTTNQFRLKKKNMQMHMNLSPKCYVKPRIKFSSVLTQQKNVSTFTEKNKNYYK